jgi:hypothetical protein
MQPHATQLTASPVSAMHLTTRSHHPGAGSASAPVSRFTSSSSMPHGCESRQPQRRAPMACSNCGGRKGCMHADGEVERGKEAGPSSPSPCSCTQARDRAARMRGPPPALTCSSWSRPAAPLRYWWLSIASRSTRSRHHATNVALAPSSAGRRASMTLRRTRGRERVGDVGQGTRMGKRVVRPRSAPWHESGRPAARARRRHARSAESPCSPLQKLRGRKADCTDRDGDGRRLL